MAEGSMFSRASPRPARVPYTTEFENSSYPSTANMLPPSHHHQQLYSSDIPIQPILNTSHSHLPISSMTGAEPSSITMEIPSSNPLTPNPFTDPVEVLPQSGQAPRHCATRFRGSSHTPTDLIQRPQRTHQSTAPLRACNGSDHSHSRHPTDLSRQATDLENASMSRYHRALISSSLMWLVAAVAQISALSATAAMGALINSMKLKNPSVTSFVWATISLVLFVISAIAGVAIYKIRQKRRLCARFQREASLDSQWHLLQDMNSYHRSRNNTSNVSVSRLPQSFEQSSSSRNPNPAVAVNQDVPTSGRLEEQRQCDGNLQKVQSRDTTDPQLYQENINSQARSARGIVVDNNGFQNQSLQRAFQATPLVLFRTPLVPLPSAKSQGPAQFGALCSPGQDPFRDPHEQSVIDLDEAFDSTTIHREDEDVTNHENEAGNPFPYQAFNKTHHPRAHHCKMNNPLGISERSPSPQFIIGSSETSSPHETQGPFTPDDNLRQFSASPSYSNTPSDSDSIDNVDYDEPDEPGKLGEHGEPLQSYHAGCAVGDELRRLNSEERRMYFEQRRRCFSTQENLAALAGGDSGELDNMLNIHPSTPKAAKGKEKEIISTIGRAKSALAGDLEFAMGDDAFSPIHSHDQGFLFSGQFIQPKFAASESPSHVQHHEPENESRPFSPKLQPLKTNNDEMVLKSTPKKLQLKFSPQRAQRPEEQIYALPSPSQPGSGTSDRWIRGLPTKVTATDWKGDEIPVTVKPWTRV